MAKAPKAKTKAVKVNFHEQLILNKWLWSKFNPNRLEGMKQQLDYTLLCSNRTINRVIRHLK